MKRGLANYQNEQYWRSVNTPNGANQGGPLGPLVTPITQGDLPVDPASRVIQLLEQLPLMMMRSILSSLLIPGRDAQYFLAPSAGSVSVPAGTKVIVATIQTEEKFAGGLLGIGMNVLGGSFPDIQWSIEINGSIHPGFSNIIMESSTLSTPFPFKMELVQQKKYDLVATNTSAAPISVQGNLLGYKELLLDWKQWGTSAESGVG